MSFAAHRSKVLHCSAQLCNETRQLIDAAVGLSSFLSVGETDVGISLLKAVKLLPAFEIWTGRQMESIS